MNVSDIKVVKGKGEVGTVAEDVAKVFGIHLPVQMEVVEDTISPDHYCTYVTKITGSITMRNYVSQ